MPFHPDTSLLMYDGTTKKASEIQPGDSLMCSDTTLGVVLTTSDGTDEMYEIEPNRGEKLTVTKDHMIVLQASNYEMVWYDKTRNRYRIRWLENYKIKEKSFPVKKHGSNENAKREAERYLKEETPKINGYTAYGDPADITVERYVKLSKRIKGAYKWFCTGLTFPEKVSIDPYILGYWLGDGTSADTGITTAEEEIVTYFKSFAEGLNLQFLPVGNAEYKYNVTTGTKFGGVGRNPFLNFLRENNLLNNKHVPIDYKRNSREIQLKLLAGLIDSDGHYQNNVYSFNMKSEKLVDDIIFIVRALGFFTYKQDVEKTCTNAPGGPKVGNYFGFCICGEGLEQIPVLLARKRAHVRQSSKDPCVNGFKNITAVGSMPYKKIELMENKRILLEDFSVIRC